MLRKILRTVTRPALDVLLWILEKRVRKMLRTAVLPYLDSKALLPDARTVTAHLELMQQDQRMRGRLATADRLILERLTEVLLEETKPRLLQYQRAARRVGRI